MSDSARQSKKRRLNASQSSDNSGDEGKKRGRPRVEKQDESAADRRRTQIRKAQRAYRQRKESTLEELRRRVTDLQNLMELMNKAFVECADRLAGSGLSPDQASHIRDTELQYEALMRCVRNSEEDCSLEPTETIQKASISSHPRNEASNALEPKNVPSWMDEAVLVSTQSDPAPHEVGMGYTMYLDDVPSSDIAQVHVSSQKRNSTRSTTYTAFRVEAPIPSTLPPPRTYSFHETTFARRLHRATLESGYSLALDPNRKPESFERAFRLSLLTVDRTKLTAILKDLLDRGPDDSLDSGISMVHIGGAGTHYSRRDKFGVLQPKKQSENLGLIGPQALAVLQNAVRDNLMTDLTVEIEGFEGEWFDPYDVEGYLAEKGIYIDPTSSFAEADVDLISSSPTKSSSASSSGSTMSPELQNSIRGTPENATNPYTDGVNSTGWVDFSMPRMTDIGFSDASTGSWMNFLLPGEAIKQRLTNNAQWDGSVSSQYMSDDLNSGFGRLTEPIVRQQKKRTLVIDISKFIKVLISHGSCLGKLPGFRRKDVDRALMQAAFEEY